MEEEDDWGWDEVSLLLKSYYLTIKVKISSFSSIQKPYFILVLSEPLLIFQNISTLENQLKIFTFRK